MDYFSSQAGLEHYNPQDELLHAIPGQDTVPLRCLGASQYADNDLRKDGSKAPIDCGSESLPSGLALW